MAPTVTHDVHSARERHSHKTLKFRDIYTRQASAHRDMRASVRSNHPLRMPLSDRPALPCAHACAAGPIHWPLSLVSSALRPRLRSWARLLESLTHPYVLKPNGLPSPGFGVGALRTPSFALRDSRFRTRSCLRARYTRSVGIAPVLIGCSAPQRVQRHATGAAPRNGCSGPCAVTSAVARSARRAPRGPASPRPGTRPAEHARSTGTLAAPAPRATGSPPRGGAARDDKSRRDQTVPATHRRGGGI